MQDMKMYLGVVGGIVVGWWFGIDPIVRSLIGLMVIDIATGLVAAYVTGALASEFSRKGMMKKALPLAVITALHIFSHNHELGIDSGKYVASFFCITEFISIIENCGRAGVKMPKILVRGIKKLQEQMESESEPGSNAEDKA